LVATEKPERAELPSRIICARSLGAVDEADCGRVVRTRVGEIHVEQSVEIRIVALDRGIEFADIDLSDCNALAFAQSYVVFDETAP